MYWNDLIKAVFYEDCVQHGLGEKERNHSLEVILKQFRFEVTRIRGKRLDC